MRAKEELIKKLSADAEKLKSEVSVHEQDLQYLQKLEGFTGTTLTALTREGRLDSEAILSLSKFIMDRRAAKATSETDLRQRLQANKEAAELARKQLAELSAGSGRTERDAVIVVSKSRPAAGIVRLGYMVSAATWTPQYRLRGGADNAPSGSSTSPPWSSKPARTGPPSAPRSPPPAHRSTRRRPTSFP